MMLRALARRGLQLSQRSLSTTAARQQEVIVISQHDKEVAYPKLGNRDVVGYGFNGNPTYQDRPEMPMPAVRFMENTPEVMALREKEKGDWKNLSLEDKKALYRASFRETFAEMHAPNAEWKRILALTLLGVSVTGWLFIFLKLYVYPPMPVTITKEWKEVCLQRMVDQRQGPIEGIASNYDYEKGQWK